MPQVHRTKFVTYINWLNTFLNGSVESYRIGKGIENNRDEFTRRGYAGLIKTLQNSSKTKVLLDLGLFYEEKHDPRYDKYTIFALLKHLEHKSPPVPIYSRAKAFEFMSIAQPGILDEGQPARWINQRIATSLAASIRRGPHKEQWEKLLFYRNHDVAHRQSFNRRTKPKLIFNDIFDLIRLGKNIQTTLDGIYLNWGFATDDPEEESVSQRQLAALSRGEEF